MARFSRREALKKLAAGLAVAAWPGGVFANGARGNAPEVGRRIPLLHVTDLYHPPQDPDDHVDLATIVALREFDLRGVVLDVTQRFLDPAPAGWDVARVPGYAPVAELGDLCGRTIPVAAGPKQPLRDPGDAAQDRAPEEQAGIALLLDVLAQSAEPVTVSVVGSARVVAAAFNRAPALMRHKVGAVLLNAGATGGTKREWNVGLDAAAYVALWRSGLPIHWFPCATERSAFAPEAERGTFWKASHATLFRDLPAGLRGWFERAFTETSPTGGDPAAAQAPDPAAWARVLAGERNLWATISLVMAAQRVLAHTIAGWRFVPAAEAAAALELWPVRLDPIRAVVDDETNVRWEPAAGPEAANARLFGRKPGAGYGAAMAEALNALLRDFPR